MQSGPTQGQWFYEDVKPRARVPVQYVPQLQLHMLATGLRSALFVSRTSCHGTKVYRMARDDEFCKDMMALVSRFHREWVARARRPPRNPMAKMERWARFAKRTHALSLSTKQLAALAAAEVPLGQAQPLFV